MEQEVQEVDAETQAAMAVKLADNVRELIRSEVKAALEDHGFVNMLISYPLSDALMGNIISNVRFRDAVLGAVRAQLNNISTTTYYTTTTTGTRSY